MIRKVSEYEGLPYVILGRFLFETKEYSTFHKCKIISSYYQGEDNSYLEHVIRMYGGSSSIKEAYYIYDSPYPIISAIIHSADNSYREEAEEFIAQFLKQSYSKEVFLPNELKEQIETYAQMLLIS